MGTAFLRFPSGNHATFGTKIDLSGFGCFSKTVAFKCGPFGFKVADFFAFFCNETELEPFKMGFAKCEASFHFFAPLALAMLRDRRSFGLNDFWLLFHMYPPIALQLRIGGEGLKLERNIQVKDLGAKASADSSVFSEPNVVQGFGPREKPPTNEIPIAFLIKILQFQHQLLLCLESQNSRSLSS